MRVAVTGSTGFLGSSIVAALRARSHEVRTLDRQATGDLEAVADWAPHLAGVDAIVHLAALAHARGVDESKLRAVNVDASLSLGRAAAVAGVRMIFMSSAKVLGEETSSRAFDDASPLDPRDAYARAKAAAEQGLRGIGGLRLSILRPPLVYGPGVRANFLALLRAVARGWPLPFTAIHNRRSLIGVGNLADAVVHCVADTRADGRTLLISDGEPLSTPELCRRIARALGRDARLFPFPPSLLEILPPARKLTRSFEVDDLVFRRELGWSPPQSLDAGLAETAAWFRTAG